MTKTTALRDEMKPVNALSAQSISVGSTNGTPTDTKGYECVGIVLQVGTMGTAGTLDVKVQESSDAGASDSWSDVSGASFTQLMKASHDNSVHFAEVDCSGTERYLRVVATAGVTASSAGVTFILCGPERAPVTQSFSTGFSA